MPIAEVPDLLVVGHVCHDQLTQGGFALGGAVSYSALLTSRLGHRVMALTSFGPDFLFEGHLAGVNLAVVPALRTTVFENIYHNGLRTQYLHARASPLAPEHLPAQGLLAKAVILCPIADEVDPAFIRAFSGHAVVCVCPQGWMRQWGPNGKVSAKHLDNWELLAQADIICMSENDVDRDWDLIAQIGKLANLLIVTQGAQGATAYRKGQASHFPAFPVMEVDPTGAGDVFAAAFTLKFSETKQLEPSVAYAHAAASLRVEGKGMQALPAAVDVEKRKVEYQLLM